MWERGIKKKKKENLYNNEILKSNMLFWDALAFLQLLLMK